MWQPVGFSLEVTSTSLITRSQSPPDLEVTSVAISRDDAVLVALSRSIHAGGVPAQGRLLPSASLHRRKRGAADQVVPVALLHAQAAATSETTVGKPVVGNVGETHATVGASRGQLVGVGVV